MLSIDSISRLNLIRAMPKTAQHLYDSGWFELQGYNKVNELYFYCQCVVTRESHIPTFSGLFQSIFR